ncbi:MAG: hypothetical protein U9R74_02060, partial [Pseudomonadota bacterium]|nr:hypothetical protein [Pseudomonadota bacterium]
YVPPCVGQFVQCLVHGIFPYGHDSVGLKCNLILPTMNQALSFIGLELPRNSLALRVFQEALYKETIMKHERTIKRGHRPIQG